jgi:hypothetical protein
LCGWRQNFPKDFLQIFRLHIQKSHIPFPRSPGEADSSVNAHRVAVVQTYPAAVKKVVVSRSENQTHRPFPGKNFFFREIQGIAGKIDNLVVGFHLGKIGVDGKVGGEVVGEAVFYIQPGIFFKVECIS